MVPSDRDPPEPGLLPLTARRQVARQPVGAVLFATPFRVFFLGAAVMAALWIPGWLGVLYGHLEVMSDLGPIAWHWHEMVFGYAVAVLLGFLLTATSNWTGRTTLRGWPLALLAVTWCAGRAVALRSAELPWFLAPAIDGAVLVVGAGAIARSIIASKSWRNAAFPFLLLGLAVSDFLVHLSASGRIDWMWQPRALRLALDVLAIVIILFAARVVPMFTRNAVPGFTVRPRGLLDRAGLAAVWALAATNLLMPASTASYVVALAAGVLNLARLWGWGGSRTLGKPILWVLHAAWAMVALSFVAHAVAGLTAWMPPSATTHLFTVGGLGLFTLGMMARVALGHTGRTLVVPPVVGFGFAVILVAALARVIPAAFFPRQYELGLWIAAGAWALAFGVFAIRYLPVFVRPRVDGKPG